MKWQCHRLIWGINLFAILIIITFCVVFLIDSLQKNWWAGIFVPLIICIGLLAHLLTLPYQVLIKDDLLMIIWPWNNYKIRRDQIRKIVIRQHWLKTVYILVLQKRFTLHNIIPILLVWELQPDDAPNIAAAIHAWWQEEGSGQKLPIPTNEQVSFQKPWVNIAK